MSLCGGIQIIGCSVPDGKRWIAIAEGWSAHQNGATLTPAEVLAFQPSQIKEKDGKLVEIRESSGWFGRRSDMLGCPWFPAFVQRMAAGDLVLLDEIRNAYCSYNHARNIPTGTWAQLAREWSKARDAAA